MKYGSIYLVVRDFDKSLDFLRKDIRNESKCN